MMSRSAHHYLPRNYPGRRPSASPRARGNPPQLRLSAGLVLKNWWQLNWQLSTRPIHPPEFPRPGARNRRHPCYAKGDRWMEAGRESFEHLCFSHPRYYYTQWWNDTSISAGFNDIPVKSPVAHTTNLRVLISDGPLWLNIVHIDIQQNFWLLL